jgi:hypothetical protein
METFYTWCAVVGVVLIGGQFFLSLLGFGHETDLDGHGEVDFGGADFGGDGGLDADHDLDHGADHGLDQHGGAWFVGILSARAILAALTVFGLAGLTAQKTYEPGLAFSIASASGAGVLLLVGWLLKTFYGFAADGTVHIEDALGARGKVYLPVPAAAAGHGKVTVHVGTRTVELAAVTTGEKLPTGTPVVVTAVTGPKLVEVARAE